MRGSAPAAGFGGNGSAVCRSAAFLHITRTNEDVITDARPLFVCFLCTSALPVPHMCLPSRVHAHAHTHTQSIHKSQPSEVPVRRHGFGDYCLESVKGVELQIFSRYSSHRLISKCSFHEFLNINSHQPRGPSNFILIASAWHVKYAAHSQFHFLRKKSFS